MPPVFLLCTTNSATENDLRDVLEGAGFFVRTQAFAGALSDDVRTTISAIVIDVHGDGSAAAAKTRRLRAELADDLMPILWVIPETDSDLAALGLNSGADAVLARPVDPKLFLAQVSAAIRTRAAAVRVEERSSEYRLLAEQLTRLRQQIDQEYTTARRIHYAMQHRTLPQAGAVHVHVGHRTRGRAGADFYGVEQVSPDQIAFIIGNVSTSGLLASLLATSLCTSTLRHSTTDPGHWLGEINRELLGITTEDPPLVAASAGVIDVHTGELRIARAGMQAPVLVPACGEVVAMGIPGTFLGTSEISCQTHHTRLLSGDKLLIGTDAISSTGITQGESTPSLISLAAEHRHEFGQALIDAVMKRVLAEATQVADVTILTLGFTNLT